MKVKQTVAAVCLAAIMATSVGAAAGARDTAPLQSEGKWTHSCGSNVVGSTIKSEFETYICGWAWAYAQNDKLQGEDDTQRYGKKAVSKVTQVDGRNFLEKLYGVALFHHEWWNHWGNP